MISSIAYATQNDCIQDVRNWFEISNYTSRQFQLVEQIMAQFQ
jgi:hypothetical protein